MIFAYLPCKCLWSNNFLRFPTYTSVCVFVYVYKHACVYKLACVSVYLYLCVNVSVHMSEYLCMCKSVVCQIYLACTPNEPKSAKCENGTCMCLCLSVYVCVWYAKCKISIFWHVCQMRQKVQNVNFLKNS